MKFKDFNDNATRWLCILILYICILHNDLMRGHEDLVMLHSITGSYGWPVIEVAYGEILFHSTEVVWELIAREEWLGYRHDTSPMFDIPGSIPVWAQYILFSSFYYIKIYIHIMFLKKNYIYYKRPLVVFDLILARYGSENIFDHPWALKREFKNHRRFYEYLYILYDFT